MIGAIVCPWCRSVRGFVSAVVNLNLKRCLSRTTVLATKTKSVVDKESIDMSKFPVENIRNFSIIAHIDHGKSTLADRLLELTGTISSGSENKQVLDKLQVERERGITVKAQTASLFYNYKGKTYLLNLIDTPGHVDFSYEVSRSLSACQGVVLLVDANQGVQAQTVANFYLAFEAELKIIPVMNKIDLRVADPDRVTLQMENLFDIKEDEIIKVSAKLGTGIEDVLTRVIDNLPPPVSDPDKPLKALLFDSWYNQYRGAILNVAIQDGCLSVGDKITSIHTGKTYDVKEIGIMHPEQTPTKKLHAGQVGYLVAGMHNIQEAQIGDTLHHYKCPVEPMSGFKPAKPMVFAGMYPVDQSDFVSLRSAIDRLTLNDSSVTVNVDSSPALGQGWRLGFLGLLHMDVFNQRLEQEYNAAVIVTAPSVPYKATLRDTRANRQEYGDMETLTITNPSRFPERHQVVEYFEPMVSGTIITPGDYVGKVINLCLSKRGIQTEYTYIDDKRVLMKYKLPLNEIVVDFYDQLKSVTSGYASFDYEDAGYESADLVKMDILLNGRPVEELATIVLRRKAADVGRVVCERLKESIPRQLYQIAIQAALGSKIVARENIQALRKNVLAKCYGGDISRKMKLLKRQAEGKKKMRKIGNIDVPRDAFLTVLKR